MFVFIKFSFYRVVSSRERESCFNASMKYTVDFRNAVLTIIVPFLLVVNFRRGFLDLHSKVSDGIDEIVYEKPRVVNH